MKPKFTDVYIIYSADVIADGSRFIDQMSPAHHLPAGHSERRKPVLAAIAAKFTETENDEQYDYGYLADEHNGDVRYYPYGYLDSEAIYTDRCIHCRRLMQYDADTDTYIDERGYELCAEYGNARHESDEDALKGQGQHRKWVAELTGDEWLAFADSYLIDLDSDGLPERHENTLGSLTVEYGHIPALSVDNTEGWEDSSGRQVIDSQMYVSFGGENTVEAYVCPCCGNSVMDTRPICDACDEADCELTADSVGEVDYWNCQREDSDDE